MQKRIVFLVIIGVLRVTGCCMCYSVKVHEWSWSGCWQRLSTHHWIATLKTFHFMIKTVEVHPKSTWLCVRQYRDLGQCKLRWNPQKPAKQNGNDTTTILSTILFVFVSCVHSRVVEGSWDQGYICWVCSVCCGCMDAMYIVAIEHGKY